MRSTGLSCALAALVIGCGSSEPSRRDGPAAGFDGGSPDGDAGPDASPARRDARSAPSSEAGSLGSGSACGQAELTTERVVPRVWLLIDGSGSMLAPLADLTGPSRFAVLREALLAPDRGLVPKLAGAVAFGLMIYDGGTSPPGVYIPGICPRVIVVEPALDNFAAIDAAYPAEPTGASTPTHYALLDLQMRIEAAMSDEPSFVLLATDGKPNLCDFHDGIPASVLTEQEAVDTVTQLQASGTGTFALSMAGEDADLQAHLSAIAEAGGTGTSVFSPASQDDLLAALTEIFGGTQSCTIAVEGTIVAGKECSGEVQLNGSTLRCQTDYRVGADGRSLELLADACKALRSEPTSTLSARFDCNDVILL